MHVETGEEERGRSDLSQNGQRSKQTLVVRTCDRRTQAAHKLHNNSCSSGVGRYTKPWKVLYRLYRRRIWQSKPHFQHLIQKCLTMRLRLQNEVLFAIFQCVLHTYFQKSFSTQPRTRMVLSYPSYVKLMIQTRRNVVWYVWHWQLVHFLNINFKTYFQNYASNVSELFFTCILVCSQRKTIRKKHTLKNK